MKLSKDEVKHIANLARLDLNEKEIIQYQEQLSDILSYIDQLQEVNTSDVDGVAQVGDISNIYREDEVQDWNESEQQAALDLAPEFENDQYKVKKVL